MDDYNEIYRVISLKIFDSYFNKIYRPLFRLKQIDIACIDKRKDYQHVLMVKSDIYEEHQFCMHKIFAE